ncbi:probable zinc transporter 8 [Henckelia pumila]|uniref:probable zinc transporter 8 n=1 Tax=Henckelia pumila TaxID=405737 RepID=UPI003C6DF379
MAQIPTKSLLIFIFLFLSLSQPHASVAATSPPQCSSGTTGECRDKGKAFVLKLVAIAAIFATSMIGVCLPFFSRKITALQSDKDLFILVKAFASGVILATGYMHVMPDSFDCLTSDCLPENPWRKFPFTTFVAMLSAILTLMVDSYAMSYYRKHRFPENDQTDENNKNVNLESQDFKVNDNIDASQLLRYRVVAQVLELGIVVHSVVIGLSMGASDNPCTIRPLVAALCFHQLFEGMGLGGCILQAEYGLKVKAIMVVFFSGTTPLGIAMGLGLSNVYSENSPTALIVVGLLNACSAGLLNYMALVDLLASDFMGVKLQKSMKLQTWAYVAVLLGAGGMSLMAKWA